MDTITTPNAFAVVGVLKNIHIHFTHAAASAAGSAFVRINRQTVEGYPVKQGVKCAQRADPFAEWTVKEHRQYDQSQQQAAFPGEQWAETCADALIGQSQGDSSLQDTGGTNVFAEIWVTQADLIYRRHGQYDDEHSQNHILEIGQNV